MEPSPYFVRNLKLRLHSRSTATAGSSSKPKTVFIRPSHGLGFPNLRELWEYRELIYFFAWREIKVRYKQTVLGAAWAVIQPLLNTIIFTVFFGNLAKIPSEGVPYPVFAFAALVPWTYFSNSITNAGNALVAQQQIITKVYFPRVIVPMATIFASLLDFLIAFLVLLGILPFYGVSLSLAILSVPLLILFTAASAVAVGLWLSALNVLYRDIRVAVPFLVQFWLFATPIAYPASLVPIRYRALYGINPLVGIIEGFRWSTLGTSEDPWAMLVSLLVVVILLTSGLLYFARVERVLADVV